MLLKITMPNEDITHVLTTFNKAIKFCETEFGYGKTIEIEKWKEIKKSKEFSIVERLPLERWFVG